MSARCQAICVGLVDWLYSSFARSMLFRMEAQRGHDIARGLLRIIDRLPFSFALAAFCRSILVTRQTTRVGGVVLSQRLILAAGILKGAQKPARGRASEAAARKVYDIPGWRFVPSLAGPVEFGSFTRHPRAGNTGKVAWRTEESRSTQNRIGLRNVGACDAAQFLAQRARAGQLTKEYGINIAVTPGVTDINDQKRDTIEALDYFLDAEVHPAWFTLNLSCPNTEDDPLHNQLANNMRLLCRAFVNRLQERADDRQIPLWIKIGPGLSPRQYHLIMQVAQETGVRAVIATNTLAKPSPDDDRQQAGVGGGELFPQALEAVRQLQAEKNRQGYDVDVIACGGILDGESLLAYEELGVKAAQYWSALVYRGPFAAAIIEHENAKLKRRPEHQAIQRESLA